MSALNLLSAQFLEAVNGVLTVIYIGILLVFGHYIYGGFKKFGVVRGYQQRTAAIGISILILGEMIIRCSVWIVRHLQNQYGWEGDAGWILVTWGTTTGVLICIVGGSCTLRHFGPKKHGYLIQGVIILTALIMGIGLSI
jgi:hypothetical protein